MTYKSTEADNTPLSQLHHSVDGFVLIFSPIRPPILWSLFLSPLGYLVISLAERAVCCFRDVRDGHLDQERGRLNQSGQGQHFQFIIL